MESIASLFCHVPKDLPETEAQQELQRQRDVLVRHAAHTGRAIEHCFFHVGEFNFEKPDEVLLHFMQRAQANNLGLVFAEKKELFPVSRQECIPYMEMCFVREGVQEILGREDVQVGEEELRPKNIYVYRGF